MKGENRGTLNRSTAREHDTKGGKVRRFSSKDLNYPSREARDSAHEQPTTNEPGELSGILSILTAKAKNTCARSATSRRAATRRIPRISSATRGGRLTEEAGESDPSCRFRSGTVPSPYSLNVKRRRSTARSDFRQSTRPARSPHRRGGEKKRIFSSVVSSTPLPTTLSYIRV